MIGWKRCCAALALGSLGIAALAGRPWVTAGDLPPDEPHVVVESATAEGGCKSCGKFCGSCAKNGKRFFDCLFGCGMKCDNPPRRYYRVVAGNPTMDVTYLPGGSVIESSTPDAQAPAGIAVPPDHAGKPTPQSLPPQPPRKEIYELPASSGASGAVAQNPVGQRLNKLGATYQLEAPRQNRAVPHQTDESVATKLKTLKIPSLEFKGRRAEEYAKSKPVEQPAEIAPSKEEKAAAVARDYRPLSPPKAAVAGGAPALQESVAVQGYKRTGQKVLPLAQYPVAKSGPKSGAVPSGNVATVATKPAAAAKASSAPTQVATKAPVAPKAMATAPVQANPAPKATAPVLVTARKAVPPTAPSNGVSGSVTQAAATAKPTTVSSQVQPAAATVPANRGVTSSPVKPATTSVVPSNRNVASATVKSATAPASASPSVKSVPVKPAFAMGPSTTTGVRRTAPAAASAPPARPKEFVSRTFSRKREAATSVPPAAPARSSTVVKVGPPPVSAARPTTVAANSSQRSVTFPQAKPATPAANPWLSKSGVAPPKVAIGQRTTEEASASAVPVHEIPGPGPVVRAAVAPKGESVGSVNTVSHETADTQDETVKRPFWKKGWEAVKELSKPGW